MYMSGSFGGNLYVFFTWNGKTYISEHEQIRLAIILGSISIIGSFVFLLSRPIPEDEVVDESTTGEVVKKYVTSAWTLFFLLYSIILSYE